jgi:hypothetical protein
MERIIQKRREFEDIIKTPIGKEKVTLGLAYLLLRRRSIDSFRYANQNLHF